MAVRLVAVTKENWRNFIDLEVTEEQSRFFHYRTTKPNLFSLAQLSFSEGMVPLGILDDEAVIGMILYSPDLSAGNGGGNAWLTRFMIDRRFQGKGFGRRAMELLIERIRVETKGKRTRLGLAYEPENAVAEGLYKGLGFRDSEERLEGQKVAWKDIGLQAHDGGDDSTALRT